MSAGVWLTGKKVKEELDIEYDLDMDTQISHTNVLQKSESTSGNQI